MEFLKEILGEELFGQFQGKLNAYNGDEAHKDKLIKLANLADGGYVSKDKYASLETDLAGKGAELEKANGLIGELKKSAGQDETLKGKISGYETTIAALKAENDKLKVENALKFALARAGAVDVDYLAFKAEGNGEIKLDAEGKIKGEADLVSGLKTQFPAMFGAAHGGARRILENPLPAGGGEDAATREQFLRMGVQERSRFKAANEALYRQYTGKG